MCVCQCGVSELVPWSLNDSESRLLSAVLTSLSQLHSTRLTDVMPLSGCVDISSRPQSRDRAAAAVSMTTTDDNHSVASGVLGTEAANYPLLVGHMLHQTQMELVGRAHSWTFRDVLDRLLIIAGNPVRHALGQVKIYQRLCVCVCVCLCVSLNLEVELILGSSLMNLSY